MERSILIASLILISLVFIKISVITKYDRLLDEIDMRFEFTEQYNDSLIILGTQIENDILLNNPNYEISKNDFLKLSKFNVWRGIVKTEQLNTDVVILEMRSYERFGNILTFTIIFMVLIIIGLELLSPYLKK